MDFNRIKHLAKNQDLKQIIKKPEILYKFYAETCDLIDWLKIYKTNKKFALQIHDWLYSKILEGTECVNLSEFRYRMSKDELELLYENLNIFLLDKSDIQMLLINHRYFSQKTKQTIEKTTNLKYLTITNISGEILPIPLKSLENLHLRGEEDARCDELDLQILTYLPILNTLILTDLSLNIDSINTFKHIKIDNLILNNIDLTDDDITITDLNHMLASTNKITLRNTHILFHQILLHNCFANTLNIHSLTISLPKFLDNRFTLDYSAICNAKNLKSIKIIALLLDDLIIYTLFKKILAISQKHIQLQWDFEIEIAGRRSQYLELHSLLNYDNYETFAIELIFKMKEVTRIHKNIYYTISDNIRYLDQHQPYEFPDSV